MNRTFTGKAEGVVPYKSDRFDFKNIVGQTARNVHDHD